MWGQRQSVPITEKLSPGPGQGLMLPSDTRGLAGGKKKRIVIKFTKSFYVPKHLYVLTLSMRKLLLAFLKES